MEDVKLFLRTWLTGLQPKSHRPLVDDRVVRFHGHACVVSDFFEFEHFHVPIIG